MPQEKKGIDQQKRKVTRKNAYLIIIIRRRCFSLAQLFYFLHKTSFALLPSKRVSLSRQKLHHYFIFFFGSFFIWQSQKLEQNLIFQKAIYPRFSFFLFSFVSSFELPPLSLLYCGREMKK